MYSDTAGTRALIAASAHELPPPEVVGSIGVGGWMGCSGIGGWMG
jgi:hypothetical protein